MKRFGKIVLKFFSIAKLLANCVNTFVKARRKQEKNQDQERKGYVSDENSKRR